MVTSEVPIEEHPSWNDPQLLKVTLVTVILSSVVAGSGHSKYYKKTLICLAVAKLHISITMTY